MRKVEKIVLDEVICAYKKGEHDAKAVAWLEGTFLKAADIFYPVENGGYFDLFLAVEVLQRLGTDPFHRLALGVLEEWMNEAKKLDEDDYVFGNSIKGKTIPIFNDPADEQFPGVSFFAQIVKVDSASASNHDLRIGVFNSPVSDQIGYLKK